ncbi:22115_t:CDS:2, partial [Entrophospora sp. SA101]
SKKVVKFVQVEDSVELEPNQTEHRNEHIWNPVENIKTGGEVWCRNQVESKMFGNHSISCLKIMYQPYKRDFDVCDQDNDYDADNETKELKTSKLESVNEDYEKNNADASTSEDINPNDRTQVATAINAADIVMITTSINQS